MGERRTLLLLSVSARRPGLLLVLLSLGTAVVPAGTALSTGWLVTELTGVVTGRGPSTSVVAPLLVLFVLLVTDEVLKVLSGAVEQYVAGRIDARLRSRVRAMALAPAEMSHLEDPDFADDAARASGDQEGGLARSAGAAAVGQLRLVFRLLGAVGAAVVVAVTFSVALAVLLVAVCLTIRALLRRWWLRLAEIGDERTGLRRRAQYWTGIASDTPAAKEVRLFGLHDWVVRRRTREMLAWAEGMWSAHRGVLRRQYWIAALAAVAAGSALLFPALAAIRGDLPVADLMAVLVAAWGVFAISAMGQEAFDIEFGLGAVRALGRLDARPVLPGAGGTVVAPGGPPEIRAEQLTFRYPAAGNAGNPGHPGNVVDGLDLTIRPGEVLAVVGHNGVGKTTLIKVIAGLYLPTAGRLSVDGRPVTEDGLAGWRQRVATVFQHFNQYPLSAADNIALAAPEHRDDRAGILAAAELAGAATFLGQLPDGYDTVLTPRHTGGTDLSGGQWQRIAIARAVFAVRHGRDLVILDEPTAHLDVEAEAGFYRQIVRSVGAATVVLISHRLSTVRDADRIAVLAGGRIAELGSHDELMAADGGYAGLFRLQAARFTTPVVDGGAR